MGKLNRLKHISIDALKPYENNAKKHSNKQLELIANSIKEFGFISPCLVDADNNLIAGHGRVEAARIIGLDNVPCVCIDGLTDDQRRAYIIADNRLTELGDWDMDKLYDELEHLDLSDVDLDLTGFSFDDIKMDLDDGGYYGDERERTNRAYNLDIAHETDMTNDFWQMPVLQPEDYIPERLIGFNYAKSSKEKNAGIHFYVDDYQFERVWSYPEKYVDILSKYECILTPDFSLYMDMPMPMKIWNIYRSRQIGAFYQSKGIKVIPTLSWAEPETYQFCFQGVPKGSVVSVSTVGVKHDAIDIWSGGMDEAIRQLEPSTVLEYGGDIGYDYGNIAVKRYDNEVTNNWKEHEDTV